MPAIKVRRSGIHRIFKKTPLRGWLDEQLRSSLTFKKDIERRDGKGWTTEEFARECWHHGLDIRVGTVFKWCSGTHPRTAIYALRGEFPSIIF